jgi:hypothetical protein
MDISLKTFLCHPGAFPVTATHGPARAGTGSSCTGFVDKALSAAVKTVSNSHGDGISMTAVSRACE